MYSPPEATNVGDKRGGASPLTSVIRRKEKQGLYMEHVFFWISGFLFDADQTSHSRRGSESQDPPPAPPLHVGLSPRPWFILCLCRGF